MGTEIERHPVQNHHRRGQGYAPKTVTMAAYEVYRHVYGPQDGKMCAGWVRARAEVVANPLPAEVHALIAKW